MTTDEIDHVLMALNHIRDLLTTVTDSQSYQSARDEFLKVYPHYNGELPEEYDETFIESKRQEVESERQEFFQKKLNIDLSESLSTARNILRAHLGKELNPSNDNLIQVAEMKRLTLQKLIESENSISKRNEYDRLEGEIVRAVEILQGHAAYLRIRNDPNKQAESDSLLYCMGRSYQILMDIEKKRIERIMDLGSRAKNQKNIKEGRWDKVGEIIQRGLLIAEEKWECGDSGLHHEMAEYLHNRYPEISTNVWRKKLKPIADKYGRLFGKKGVKKQNK